MLELNKVYNEDCLIFMKRLPDDRFDLIITDPPYGINIASNGHVGGEKLGPVKDYCVCDWDKEIPSKEVFDEMLRVSKNQIIFGGNYFIEYLHNSSCWIVWDKNNTGNFADCELAWTSFNTAVRKFKHTWNGMLQERMNWKEKREHPTQKPVPLGRWILEKYANEGDKIFDPFAGSGSFLVACKNKGFDFVGCEINKEYVSICNNRLNQKGLSDFTEDRKLNNNLKEESK